MLTAEQAAALAALNADLYAQIQVLSAEVSRLREIIAAATENTEA